MLCTRSCHIFLSRACFAPGVSGFLAASAAPNGDLAAIEQQLEAFVSLRTVSCEVDMAEECVHGAKFLRDMLETYLAAEAKLIFPPGKNPVVLGR